MKSPVTFPSCNQRIDRRSFENRCVPVSTCVTRRDATRRGIVVARRPRAARRGVRSPAAPFPSRERASERASEWGDRATRERTVPRGSARWWGVSRGLSGDFMYITMPKAGTRAVHCWLTGRRSRRSRVLSLAALQRSPTNDPSGETCSRVCLSSVYLESSVATDA